MTDLRVFIDAPAGAVLVGTARVARRRGIDITEFTYGDAYLAGAGWAVSPDLPILEGRAVAEGLPGALDDSAPDAWGRNLIMRSMAARSTDAALPGPTPTAVDFLLGASDVTRQGALRFCLDEGGPFLAEGGEVPRLLELATLLEAARRVSDDEPDDRQAVEALLAAGSGSLGGARPKASVLDGDTLQVAKFPHHGDAWDVIRWEAVALDLAGACGLRVPAHELIEVGSEPVLLVERFDRGPDGRVPFLSGKSLIRAEDGRASDYLELVDALTEHGSDVAEDLVELWRRIAFSLAINNVDDHMRNHAVLRGSGGWTLSPVFDINPDPRAAAGRVTSLAGATSATECFGALFATTRRFGLAPSRAAQLWRETRAVTGRWRGAAARRGISTAAQDEFAASLDRSFPTP